MLFNECGKVNLSLSMHLSEKYGEDGRIPQDIAQNLTKGKGKVIIDRGKI